MSNPLPRWLNPADTARYIGVRMDALPRLVRAGKLPEPSRHLGPRSPRYDREAIDDAFAGTTLSADIREAVEAFSRSIMERGPLRRGRPGRL